MDYLFGDELCAKIAELQIFVTPTCNQFRSWLNQTAGKLDDELLTFLNIPAHPDRISFVYNGPLTTAQRAWCFQSLNE
jgi:hypothetical protein